MKSNTNDRLFQALVLTSATISLALTAACNKSPVEAKREAEAGAHVVQKPVVSSPILNIERPKLADTDPIDDRSAIVVYKMTQHRKPKFYDGNVPFEYEAGKRRMGLNEMYTVYHQFPGWTTVFIYDDPDMKFSGIAQGARVIRRDGRILAEAKMSNLLHGSGIEVDEFHYDDDGNARFYCRSQFAFGLGEKQSESLVQGVKARDYFFLWPTSSF